MTGNLPKFRWLAAALCLLSGLTASAYDFMVDGLAYNILDDHTVEVTSTVRIELERYQAPDDYEYFGYYTGMWVVDGKNYVIYRNNAPANVPTDINYPGLGTAVVIPASVNHQGRQYNVTGISNLAFAFTGITSVEIPATITTIGRSAFQDCNALTAVHISDIDAWCRIDFKGFYTYAIGYTMFESGGVEYTSTGNPTEYAHHLYVNGQELTSVVIPNDVTRLNCTFHNCSNLTEVVMPESVTNLGAYTFAGTAINQLPLTEAITEIPMEAFSNCLSLSDTVTIPAHIMSIRESAFAYSPINSLFLPSTIKTIEEYSFGATGLQHIYSPADLAPCTINTLSDPYGGWSAFDEGTYQDAILHIPPGANYQDRYIDMDSWDYILGWTFFEHIEENGVPITAITLDQSSLTLAEATSGELAAVFTPSEWVDKRLTWASNNPTVATIDSSGIGKVRVNALTPGRTVVTATTTDGTNLVAACVVTVTGQGVTSIELNKTNATLSIGEQLQLTATEKPSGLTASDITWSSADEAVASVTANGLVTALSPGEATITATNPDGLQAICSITVLQPITTGITLSEQEITLRQGDTKQLTAIFTPKFASSPVVWTTTNSRVATVDGSGLVTAVTAGTAVVIATTTDGTNLSASCLVTVTEAIVGDLNGDERVDVNDLNIIINVMLDLNHDSEVMSRADIDGNGSVDVGDMNLLINIILNGSPSNKSTYTVNGVSFHMMRVAGGTFIMGGTTEQGSDAASIEKPAHQVTLSSFSIGVTQVTQALWQAVMGGNPSGFTHNEQLPVEKVSYDLCQEFISRLNTLIGQHFRFPTEAEWEYAARGGSKSQGYKYAGSDNIDAVGWCSDNAGETTHPVAQKAPNELGLYDMSGNVWEWCSDWYGAYSAEAQTNPTGPDTGTMHVCRGGGWHSGASSCRTTSRTYNVPTKATDRIGLRLAM